ncbi:hypothetical protein JYK02_17695 [Corallococcus macrosporus]|uniref:Uncharacterized protein n=1 Tax=Corallococcus macrosporus TaxID=35 RepID=A0ABS3DER5_9BACT|nr:hypothetical protein [Corallococcus macrosporus]MBN8229346.1 hypothetical protein [Corallococcus macrosporus]
MTNLPRCSEAELEVLKTMTEFMRTSVWTGPGWPVEQLLLRWQRVAETAGDYRGGIDDFIYALTHRDALEVVMEKCPPASADVLKRLVSASDEQFRAATQDDGGKALSQFRKPSGTNWWYSRRPSTGPLGTYLDTGKYGT